MTTIRKSGINDAAGHSRKCAHGLSDYYPELDGKDYLARTVHDAGDMLPIGFIDWNAFHRHCRIGRITIKGQG